MLTALLAGCGFGLRPSVDYPFRTLYSSAPRYSPLGVELKRQLPASGPLVYLTEPAKPTDAQVVLDVYGELRKKTVIGVNATGQAREFQLNLTLKFRLRTPQGQIIIPETTLTQQRTMSYDETLALAKEAEEAALYRGMQIDLVQQIVRRLAALDAKTLETSSQE
ncbi:LPS assembly lipoprotein LptE [Hylemonella gracilis]|uniref:LPS-assembly lipoprotein LptE n=1 Tax=Hylemonella gracilis TaxID=80880 RepID=UPI003D6F870B